MSPSKRFKPVQRVAQSREQKAARELGNSQRRAKDQEGRLEELKDYHQEYLERFQNAARSGISASQLQEYRAFISKLELAIREQERIVSSSHDECSSRKQVWQQKHTRTEALGKVMGRFQSEERKDSDNREQRETDDHNQRGKRKLL